MKKKHYLFILIIITMLVGCSSVKPEGSPDNGTSTRSVISIYEILSYPQRYSEQTVSICGALFKDNEGYALFINRTAGRYYDIEEGIRIEGEDKYLEPLQTCFVRITGTIIYQEDESTDYKLKLGNLENMEELEVVNQIIPMEANEMIFMPFIDE